MNVASDLLDCASRYLNGEKSLADLDMWLAEHAREIARLPDEEPMAALAGLLQVSIAELNDGLISESDIDRRLGDFLLRYLRRFLIRSDTTNTTLASGGIVHSYASDAGHASLVA